MILVVVQLLVHVEVVVVLSLSHVNILAGVVVANIGLALVEILLIFGILLCSDSKYHILNLEQVLIQLLKLLPQLEVALQSQQGVASSLMLRPNSSTLY